MAVNREYVADQLRDRIIAGEYGPGDKAPSTRELVAMYGGSRTTANAALQLLAREGMLALRGKAAAVVTDDQVPTTDDGQLEAVHAELRAMREAVRSVRAAATELEQRIDSLLDTMTG